jgi:hypothetical protein
VSTPEPPRRLRAADVIDNLQSTIEALTVRPPRQCDVEVTFTRNAKGETQTSVKVAAPHGTDPNELTALAGQVYATASATYETATRRYPTLAGTPTNDPPPDA